MQPTPYRKSKDTIPHETVAAEAQTGNATQEAQTTAVAAEAQTGNATQEAQATAATPKNLSKDPIPHEAVAAEAQTGNAGKVAMTEEEIAAQATHEPKASSSRKIILTALSRQIKLLPLNQKKLRILSSMRRRKTK